MFAHQDELCGGRRLRHGSPTGIARVAQADPPAARRHPRAPSASEQATEHLDRMCDGAGRLDQKDIVDLDLAIWNSHTEAQFHNGATSPERHDLLATTQMGS